MMKYRIMWLLWLIFMAGATVVTGSWLMAAVFLFSALLLILSAAVTSLGGRKTVIKLSVPRAAERKENFRGRLTLQNQTVWPVFGGKGQILWENLFTGEHGEIPLSFSLGCKETRTIEFEACSSWCGCVKVQFSSWKCNDFFHVFSVRRQAVAEGCTVIMPEKQNSDFSFLTREGFDMESFRYSGNRPGDDPGETYDIREYQPGDSIRQIHWKLSGKLDDIMIREKSFPVDDTVLILAEAFQAEREPRRAETVAEVLSAIIRDFMEKKIPCQVGIYDRNAGKFRQEKVRTEEDHEHILYSFLRYGSDGKTPVTVQEYLRNPGTQNYVNYIYITGNPEDKEAELLKQKGEVTVIGCGVSGGDSKGEQITWKYGSQNPEDSQKQNTENSCQISCWKLH
ncbi:MAG: DUF58 domain-containing protein [Blautia obeum]|jgi:Uncharacterized conserved protein (some members contain a von Willebrand factor type A (vWA) domain)